MILAGARGESIHLGQSTSALIDVVFLLLIYFMVTASLIRQEEDIHFMIPVSDIAKIPDVPVEALIEVHEEGDVELEGIRFPKSDSLLIELSEQLKGLRQVADTQGARFYVNVMPDPDALHYRIIDVMDACSHAGVTNLGFAKNE